MTVIVNGERQDVADDTTISALLLRMALDPDGVAVAVDRKVVPRSAHADTPLHEGAEVEVIRAVGGG